MYACPAAAGTALAWCHGCGSYNVFVLCPIAVTAQAGTSLQPPVYATALRLRPKTWHNHIALRADV